MELTVKDEFIILKTLQKVHDQVLLLLASKQSEEYKKALEDIREYFYSEEFLPQLSKHLEQSDSNFRSWAESQDLSLVDPKDLDIITKVLEFGKDTYLYTSESNAEAFRTLIVSLIKDKWLHGPLLVEGTYELSGLDPDGFPFETPVYLRSYLDENLSQYICWGKSKEDDPEYLCTIEDFSKNFEWKLIYV